MPQDQDHQKNLLLAIVLSVAVLLAWQMFYAGPKLKDEQERRQRAQQEQTKLSRSAAPTVAPGALPQAAAPAAGAAAEAQGRDAVLRTSAPARVRIDTPSLRGSIALQGGRIDDSGAGQIPERRSAPQSPNVVLFSPSGTPAPYYAEYGWVAGPGVGQPMPAR